MFKRKKLTGLLRKIIQEYPDIEVKNPFFLSSLIPQKRFQNKVLFPYFNIPTPKTIPAPKFNDESYPVFLKQAGNVGNTFYIQSSDELAPFRRDEMYKSYIVQEYIKTETEIASHIRLVLSTVSLSDEAAIRGAVVLYNKDPSEKRSNHKHGGKAIPITGPGSLENITEYEMKLLEALNINPNHRYIPENILAPIFSNCDEEGKRLYDYLKFFISDTVGIDIVFGRPYNDANPEPKWYFLEINLNPDNSFIRDTGAWIDDPNF